MAALSMMYTVWQKGDQDFWLSEIVHLHLHLDALNSHQELPSATLKSPACVWILIVSARAVHMA
jgi:hypothetical protein